MSTGITTSEALRLQLLLPSMVRLSHSYFGACQNAALCFWLGPPCRRQLSRDISREEPDSGRHLCDPLRFYSLRRPVSSSTQQEKNTEDNLRFGPHRSLKGARGDGKVGFTAPPFVPNELLFRGRRRMRAGTRRLSCRGIKRSSARVKFKWLSATRSVFHLQSRSGSKTFFKLLAPLQRFRVMPKPRLLPSGYSSSFRS